MQLTSFQLALADPVIGRAWTVLGSGAAGVVRATDKKMNRESKCQKCDQERRTDGLRGVENAYEQRPPNSARRGREEGPRQFPKKKRDSHKAGWRSSWMVQREEGMLRRENSPGEALGVRGSLVRWRGCERVSVLRELAWMWWEVRLQLQDLAGGGS